MANLTVPRTRRMVVAMKKETTYGTDALGTSYSSSDIVSCFDIAPDDRLDEIANLSLFGDIGRLPSIIGIETGQVAFSMYIRGAGAAYSAGVKPEAHMPLEAAAMIGTLDATGGLEKYSYAPGTQASHTIWIVQENGRVLQLVGCLGTVDFSMRAGGTCQARFTMQGKVGAVADRSFVTGSIQTGGYPVIKSAAFQIGAADYAPRIATVGVTLGNTLSPVLSINDATGMVGYFISDRNPRISVDPEAASVATRDWHAALLAGTLEDLTFQVGATQYNRMKFSFPKVQTVSNSWGSRDGLTSYPTQLLATIVNGNDDIAIVFD